MPQEGATGLPPRATRERRDAHVRHGATSSWLYPLVLLLARVGFWGRDMSRREGDPGGGSFSVRQWDGLAHADFFAESVCGSYICGRSVHERESDRLQYPITFDFFPGDWILNREGACHSLATNCCGEAPRCSSAVTLDFVGLSRREATLLYIKN